MQKRSPLLVIAFTATLGCEGLTADGGGAGGSTSTQSALKPGSELGLGGGECQRVPPSQPRLQSIQPDTGNCEQSHWVTLSWALPLSSVLGGTCGPLIEYEVWGRVRPTEDYLDCVQFSPESYDYRYLGTVSASTTSLRYRAWLAGDQQFTVRVRNTWGWSDYAPWSSPACVNPVPRVSCDP